MFGRFWELYNNIKLYSVSFSTSIFFSRFRKGIKRKLHQQSAVYKFLYKKIYEQLSAKQYTTKQYRDTKHIWVFWYQGHDKMPDIVKICYKQLKTAARDYSVHLLDKSNISTYVDIPPYIYKKLNEGKMSLTHFSDILRIYLLYKYGGLWCDATIFCHNNIDPIVLSKQISCISIDYNESYVSRGRWSCFFLASQPKSPLIKYLKDFFDLYWQKYDGLIDYLCIDYAIAIAYDNIESIKEDIDEGAIYLPDLYLLQNNLNAPITAELKHHISTYAFSKLSWKCETKDTDENGNQTVYSYLKSL